jgi:hypothetical protein
MAFWGIAAAVVAALWALAWWSSGRSRGLGRRRDMSETEKDYLSRGMGRGFNSGGGGGL